MHKYPKKRSSVYTDQIGLRVEPALKQALKELKNQIDEDVNEAIRIKLRELVKELSHSELAAS